MTFETLKSILAGTINVKTLTDTELRAAMDLQTSMDNESRDLLWNEKVGNLKYGTEGYQAASDAFWQAEKTHPVLSVVRAHGPLATLLWREDRRRRTNASKAASASRRAAQAVPVGTYSVNDAVEVFAFGRWYPGTVTKLGRTGKVTVQYTSGTGTTREKAVDSTKIRRA